MLEVQERTRKVVAEVFGMPLDRVTLETSHENVDDWDSLNVLNVLMAIESEFDVTISPEEAASFVSVDKILGVLRAKGIA